MPFKMKNCSTQNGERSLRRWFASYFQGTSKKEDKRRKECLKRNGEIFLSQRLAAFLGVRENVPLFSEQELKVATNNFDSKHVIFDEPFSKTYKGNLPDGRVICIKRYRTGAPVGSETIINELVILSQLNHKNVVKLIGCCLETKLPLLVCEFFSTRSLSPLLYDVDDGSSLSWLTRLHIATEIASALVYVHSRQRQSSYLQSFPNLSIVHASLSLEDVLVDDENQSIKLSGFDFAKMVRDDDESEDKMRAGFVFMDPEFEITYKLTTKSDVYGFGILLAVMLTRKKPFSWIDVPETTFGEFFLQAAREDRFVEILEPQVRNEAKLEHIQRVGQMIHKCLKDKGEERPTMMEIAKELRQLKTHLTLAQ